MNLFGAYWNKNKISDYFIHIDMIYYRFADGDVF